VFASLLLFGFFFSLVGDCAFLASFCSDIMAEAPKQKTQAEIMFEIFEMQKKTAEMNAQREETLRRVAEIQGRLGAMEQAATEAEDRAERAKQSADAAQADLREYLDGFK
jgi:hypothetical protein